jgi:alcohol dehydrogenase
MVLTHPFNCPVRVVEGHSYDEALESLIEGRRWSIVTSRGWVNRGAVDVLATRCGAPTAVIADVTANPKLSDILSLADAIDEEEVIIALGGGSVIDAAKGMAAFRAIDRDVEVFMAHLRDGAALPQDMAPKQIVAVPTTSGTGSEVTRWGTIWGDDAVKHSVTDVKLFPSHAILDPGLCVSMPSDLTLATALDALSHAMEAVWNRRHTAITDVLAETAIRMIADSLPATMACPDDTLLRGQLQTASVLAGMAMGTTQTALAHSISYPFTARYGMPHGIACSFTLAEVAKFNAESDRERLAPISRGMGCQIDALPDRLEVWFDSLGVGEQVSRYVEPSVTDQFGENLITRARAANNVRDVDGTAARQLARRALDRFCGAPGTAKSA